MSTNNPFDPVNFAKENVETAKENTLNMQNKMAQAQQKLATIEVVGKAGVDNYSVNVHLNGRHEATKVTIEPPLLQQPIDVLCGLIASAITDASHKAEAAIQSEMVNLFQDFKLPETGK